MNAILNHFLKLNTKDRRHRFHFSMGDHSMKEWFESSDSKENWEIVKRDEKVIGVGILTDLKNGVFEIAFSVDDDFRRQGIAKELYERMEKKAKKLNAKMLYASVLQSNDSVKKFLREKKFEFQPLGCGVFCATKIL